MIWRIFEINEIVELNENYEFLQFNVEFNLLVVYSPVGDVFSNAFQLRHISPFALRSIGLARIITGNCRRLSIVMNTVVCVIHSCPGCARSRRRRSGQISGKQEKSICVSKTFFKLLYRGVNQEVASIAKGSPKTVGIHAMELTQS